MAAIIDLINLTLGQLDLLNLDDLEILPLETAKPSLNIFMKGIPFVPPPNTSSGHINLFINGIPSGTQHSNNHIPLFLPGSVAVRVFPIHMNASGPATTSGNTGFNLYMNGFVYEDDSSIPLCMIGGYTNSIFKETKVDLFITGAGITENSTPDSTFFNLFLDSGKKSENCVGLYISGQPKNETEVDLYTFGIIGNPSSGVTLHMPAVGNPSCRLDLFIRGFNDIV